MPPTFYMDAVITPHRSLSRAGFYWVIGVLIVFNLLICGFLVALKAFPVPIFLGIDVLGVFLAFRANYRGAAMAERVRVSAEEVRVSHEIGSMARTVWRSPTAFTRVSVEAPNEHEAWVRLHLSGRALTIARALSPLERIAFAEALERAIQKARLERH